MKLLQSLKSLCKIKTFFNVYFKTILNIINLQNLKEFVIEYAYEDLVDSDYFNLSIKYLFPNIFGVETDGYKDCMIDLVGNLAQSTDVNQFGTVLIGAIKKAAFLTLHIRSFISVVEMIPKDEWNKEEIKVVYNYNAEKWQKVNVKTKKIVKS